MTFFLLSHNYFIRSSAIGVQPIFIKVNKFADPLGSNLKKAEVGMVLIDKYYKIL